MRTLLLYLLPLAFFLQSSPAHAEGPEGSQGALGAWLTEITMKWATTANHDLTPDLRPGGGPLVTTSIEALNAPAEVKALLHAQIARQRGDDVSAAARPIPAVALLLSQLPRKVFPDEALRQRLALPPADVSGTALAKAKLLDTSWAGTRIGINATGLSRSFLLDGTSFIELNEEDYRQRNGQIIQFEEALNTRVNSYPAAASTRRGVNGGGMATLIWATDAKFYSLTLVTDHGDAIVQGAALLKRIAEGIEG